MNRALMGLLFFGGVALAQPPTGSLTLRSPDFEPQGSIPKALTCEGKDLSPALQWSGAPKGTKSFVLIVDDPDAPDPKAPKLTFVHWVVYNLPPDAGSLPQGTKSLPTGARQGLSDFNNPRYRGPCPSVGRHRYFHKLYALDTVLPALGDKATKADVEKAMKGHVLAQAELVGTYEKGR